MISGLPLETLAFLWLGALLGGIAAGGAASPSASPRRRSGCTASIRCIRPSSSSPAACCCIMTHDLAAAPPSRRRQALAVRRRRHRRHPDRRARAARAWTPALLKRCSASSCSLFGTYALLAPRLPHVRPAAALPMPASASSAAFSAASAAIPAYCRRSGRNCAAGRRQKARAVYQPYVIVIQSSRWWASFG